MRLFMVRNNMAYKKLFRVFADTTIIDNFLTDKNEQLKKEAETIKDDFYMYDEIFTTEAKALKHIEAQSSNNKNRFNLLSTKIDLSKIVYIDYDYRLCTKCRESLWSDDIQFHNCDWKI